MDQIFSTHRKKGEGGGGRNGSCKIGSTLVMEVEVFSFLSSRSFGVSQAMTGQLVPVLTSILADDNQPPF